MKRFLLFIAIIVACSCTKKDLDYLKEQQQLDSDRIAALEEWQLEVNNDIDNIKIIIEALQDKDYIISVTELDDESGYVILFESGETITIKHGTDGTTPVVAATQYIDGHYYWSVNGEWLLDEDGNKLSVLGKDGEDGADGTDGEDGADGEDGEDGADGYNGSDGTDGISPQVRINSTTNEWEISTDGGNTWVTTGVNATGDSGDTGTAGDSFFQSVTQYDDYVEFKLKDGTTYNLLLYPLLVIKFDVDDFNDVELTCENNVIKYIPPSTLSKSDYKLISAEVIDADFGTTVTKSTSKIDWDVVVSAPTFDTDGEYVATGSVTITPTGITEDTTTALLRVTIVTEDDVNIIGVIAFTYVLGDPCFDLRYIDWDATKVYDLIDEDGDKVGEVVKEGYYLPSDDFQAIVAYPMGTDGYIDHSNGFVTQITVAPDDTYSDKCGGRLAWKGLDNLSYQDYCVVDQENSNWGDKSTINYIRVKDNRVEAYQTDYLLDPKPYYCTDVDNNQYPVVKIGETYWLGSNLRVKSYSDGTPLLHRDDASTDDLKPFISDSWGIQTPSAQIYNGYTSSAIYAHESSAMYNYYSSGSFDVESSSDEVKKIYGLGYNFRAIMGCQLPETMEDTGSLTVIINMLIQYGSIIPDANNDLKNISPKGWHIPTSLIADGLFEPFNSGAVYPDMEYLMFMFYDEEFTQYMTDNYCNSSSATRDLSSAQWPYQELVNTPSKNLTGLSLAAVPAIGQPADKYNPFNVTNQGLASTDDNPYTNSTFSDFSGAVPFWTSAMTQIKDTHTSFGSEYTWLNFPLTYHLAKSYSGVELRIWNWVNNNEQIDVMAPNYFPVRCVCYELPEIEHTN